MLGRIADGLAFRIGLLLTLAFVPIGLIAASLANQVGEQMTRRNEAALLALTSQAADDEASLIRLAVGAARAFALTGPENWTAGTNCSAPFISFQAQYPAFSFVGYVDGTGRVACGSSGVGADASTGVVFQGQRDAPGERVDVNVHPIVSDLPVIIMSVPVLKNGQFDGYIAVSLPHATIAASLDEMPPDEKPLDLITFNSDGVILNSLDGMDGAEQRMPADRSIASLASGDKVAFTARTSNGMLRVFAVTPILPGKVYVIGSWPAGSISPIRSSRALSPLIFPALMWLVSLGVAYFAVHRLVLKHIRRIVRDMDRFATTRRHEEGKSDLMTPLEIREIEQAWRGLADTILREEAELVNTILDKNVLLKEVHHRVKNNLQLISSIVNMKVRKARSPDARNALQEVQMRVMSIATVHRSLYETSMESRVSADDLLRTVINRSIDATVADRDAIDVTLDLQQIQLYPDQAVPLSLLASEVAMNAAKFVGQPQQGRPFIKARLVLEMKDRAVFELVNTVGPPLVPGELTQGTGLGSTLVAAFSQQLGGTVETEEVGGLHRVVVRFPIVDFDANPVDATIPPTV